jgi:hypothetical protein
MPMNWFDRVVHADITEEQRRALSYQLCIGVKIVTLHFFIIAPITHSAVSDFIVLSLIEVDFGATTRAAHDFLAWSNFSGHCLNIF